MNYKNMKRFITLAGLACFLMQGMVAQTIVKPSVKTKTTFAIVTDAKSYEEAKEEIDAYRTAKDSCDSNKKGKSFAIFKTGQHKTDHSGSKHDSRRKGKNNIGKAVGYLFEYKAEK